MTYDVGDQVAVITALRDPSGTPVAATVTLTVTKPDGTPLSPEPVIEDNGGVGLYKASFVVDVPGTWLFKWTASDEIVAVSGGQLSVVEAGRVLVAGLDELRAQLDRADFSDDDELRLYLEAATNQIEWFVGPLTPTEVTEQYLAVDRIAFRRFPVLSVESVTPMYAGVLSTPLAPMDYYVDIAGNQIILFPRWYAGARVLYQVVYTVGHRVIQSDIKLAGLIIAQHLWSVQNARFTLNAPGEDELAAVPGSGFMVPYRALELIRPYISISTVPGIA